MEPRKDPNEKIDRILADFQQSRTRRQTEAPAEPPVPAKEEKAPSKKEKPSKKAKPPKKEKAPRRPLSKKQKRGLWIALVCLAVAVALAFALPAIQSSRQNAYLNPTRPSTAFTTRRVCWSNIATPTARIGRLPVF